MTNASLVAANAARWKQASLIRNADCVVVARRLIASKARYLAVAERTGVPWFVIALIHSREASGDFSGVLHNGEKIIGTARKTRLIPKGRGPFASWEEAAVDALVNCHPYAARNTDWRIGATLTLLERYNGLGYYYRGLPSPYLWAGTDQYASGKYVRDGVFDAAAVDRQLGCASLLMAMQQLDSSVRLDAPGITPSAVIATTGVTATVALASGYLTSRPMLTGVLCVAVAVSIVLAGWVIWRARRKH